MKKFDKVFTRVGQAVSAVLFGVSIAAILEYGITKYTIAAIAMSAIAIVAYTTAAIFIGKQDK